VLVLRILSCFSLRDYLCVVGVPDLRGGHGAAVVNWGRATESRVYLILKSFGFGLMLYRRVATSV
jgi:hypothetical protein